MDSSAQAMMEKLESQLAQIYLYASAIESLALAHRSYPDLQQDAFLFGPVYESLWDALIVRLGAIWDETSGVASLPKLSKHLKRIDSAEARSAVKQIGEKPTPERLRLKQWRHTVVAHTKFPLDAASFDGEYQINIDDVQRDISRIETLLAKANSCLGRTPILYQFLRDEAATNAKRSLARWAGNAA